MITELLNSVASRALSIGSADSQSRNPDQSRATPTAPQAAATSGDSLDLLTVSQLAQIMQDYDLHNISPRQTKELAERLYHEADAIDLTEYMALAFQPQVDDPDTWTELTGRPPRPDVPVDLIDKLQQTLRQQQNARAHPDTIQTSEQLVRLLHSLSALSSAS